MRKHAVKNTRHAFIQRPSERLPSALQRRPKRPLERLPAGPVRNLPEAGCPIVLSLIG